MACTVTGLTPNVGIAGDTLTITGTGFGAAQGGSTVTVGGIAVASYTSWSDTQIVVVLGASTVSGLVVVTVSGAVQTDYKTSWLEVIDTTYRGVYDIRAQDERADSSPEDYRYADARDWNNLLHVMHNAIPRGLNEFRLSLTSATPVTTSDVTAATNIYHTPLTGGGNGRIALPFNTTATLWGVVSISEQTLALGTLTSGKNYDVFIYVSGSSVAYEYVAWTSDSARATALVAHGGAWLKTGALNKRYIGTFRTTSTTTTEDSDSKRFLFNADNRIGRRLKFQNNANHVYNTGTPRYWNNTSASRVEFVQGLTGDSIFIATSIAAKHSSAGGYWFQGYGYDQNAGNDNYIAAQNECRADTYMTTTFLGSQIPAVGYHYIAVIEYGGTGATTTWDQAELQTVLQA